MPSRVIARLHDLTRGLAKEIVVVREGDDPLLHPERRRYLKALRGAVAGLESARVALAGAASRLEEETTRRPMA